MITQRPQIQLEIMETFKIIPFIVTQERFTMCVEKIIQFENGVNDCLSSKACFNISQL